ncbi:MAG: hypothetical protein AB7U62_20920 [Pseudolabrys sp.]
MLSLEQLYAIRRYRNEGIGVRLTADLLGLTADDVSAAIRAGLPALPTPRQRAANLQYVEQVYVPRAVLTERAARLAAPHRNQVGALMGDPPHGYSALDRRDTPEAGHAAGR